MAKTMKKPLIHGGCILIARKIVESEIWDKPPLYIKVWIWLLQAAQHSDYKGLKRGQLHTTIEEIQEGVSWYSGYRKEKPTKDQIYQIINWLRKDCGGGNGSNDNPTMVTTTRATRGLLVTIDKYGFYQDINNYGSNNGSNDGKVTEQAREQKEPDTINNNDNNDISTRGIDYEFFNNNIGLITPFQSQMLESYLNDGLESELVLEAMKVATGANGNKWTYLNRILQNCVSQGVKTAEQFKQQSQQAAKKSKPNNKEPVKSNRSNFEERELDQDYYDNFFNNVKG